VMALDTRGRAGVTVRLGFALDPETERLAREAVRRAAGRLRG
jgi:hypothetical protein